MLDLLYSRFDFSAPNQTGQVVFLCLMIWLVVVVCAVSSIRSRGFDARTQLLLIVLVTAVPLFGILAYLPLSVRRESIPFIPFLRRKQGRA